MGTGDFPPYVMYMRELLAKKIYSHSLPPKLLLLSQ